MSRLPYLGRDQLGAEGQRVWDAIIETRGTRVIREEGGLSGPFNASLHAPNVGQHVSALGAAVRFGTSIDPRLLEIAIMTVAARWKAEYEWYAHTRLAREQGVPDAVIDAIAKGADPPFGDAAERTVYTVARQLAEDGHVSQDAYDAAQRLLGDTGMVELVDLCGYYSLVSFVLNAFTVPLPPGATPTWAAHEA